MRKHTMQTSNAARITKCTTRTACAVPNTSPTGQAKITVDPGGEQFPVNFEPIIFVFKKNNKFLLVEKSRTIVLVRPHWALQNPLTNQGLYNQINKADHVREL